MTYGFYIFICLVFIIFQTTILSLFPIFQNCPDFLLPVIVYLGFFRSRRESIPVIILFGLLMDGLSGVPFGLYVSAYFWLYVVVYALKQFLQVRNVLMLSLMTASGVLIENGMLAIAENLFNPKLNVLSIVFQVSMIQVVLAIIGGPVIIIFIKQFHEVWEIRFQNVFSGKNGE